MSVTIKTITDTEIEVNGKIVLRDPDARWLAREELTTAEYKAFRQHIQEQH